MNVKLKIDAMQYFFINSMSSNPEAGYIPPVSFIFLLLLESVTLFCSFVAVKSG